MFLAGICRPTLVLNMFEVPFVAHVLPYVEFVALSDVLRKKGRNCLNLEGR